MIVQSMNVLTHRDRDFQIMQITYCNPFAGEEEACNSDLSEFITVKLFKLCQSTISVNCAFINDFQVVKVLIETVLTLILTISIPN
jgi:hypothetical protein